MENIDLTISTVALIMCLTTVVIGIVEIFMGKPVWLTVTHLIAAATTAGLFWYRLYGDNVTMLSYAVAGVWTYIAISVGWRLWKACQCNKCCKGRCK